MAEQKYSWGLTLNPERHDWRGRLAARLRRRATKLDGYTAVIIAVNTEPKLTTQQLAAVLGRGFSTMRRDLHSEVQQEAIELMLKREHPELFGHG